MKKASKDHKGREYPTVTDMCEAYGIPMQVYQARKKLGWSLEKALETPYGCKDHKGNWFRNEKEMAKAHGVNYMTYRYRKSRGDNIEKRLNPEHEPNHFETHQYVYTKECADHMGQKFPSIKEMCEFWGVAQDAYCQRLKRGSTLKEALEGKKISDHKGNKFKNKKDMCEFWGINYETYVKRIREGYSLEDALEKQTREYIKTNKNESGNGKERKSEQS